MAVITAVLKGIPLEVTLSSSGSRSIELVASGRLEAILMDEPPPGMNGLAATCAIGRSQSSSHPPFIIGSSAHALEHHGAQAQAAGVDSYLPEPIRQTVLPDALRLRLGLP